MNFALYLDVASGYSVLMKAELKFEMQEFVDSLCDLVYAKKLLEELYYLDMMGKIELYDVAPDLLYRMKQLLDKE